MSKDLRSFLKQIEEAEPKEVLHLHDSISPKWEVTAVLQALENQGRYPVVMCHNVLNLAGKGNNKLVTNLTARRQNLALALDLPLEKWKSEVTEEVALREARPIPPVVISRSEAPVKEEVYTGDAIDLSKLPIVTHHGMDAGPYMTLTAVAKHPPWGLAPGVHNVAFHRSEYVGPRKAHFYMAPNHTWLIFKSYEEKNKPCPIAYVIGHHPTFYLSANMRPDVRQSEYDVIGGLMGEPLRLVPSETWGEELLVPADAEIVIESEMLPKVRETEAPFGEWTGYYGPQRLSPVLDIKAITHRKDPIYMTNFIGHHDHVGYSIGWEATMLKRAREADPTVRAVYLPPSGCGGYHLYVQVDKKVEGQAVNAALGAITHGHPKLVIVVDKDIDIFNEEQVLWAVATRIQAGENVQILRKLRGSSLDPALAGQTLEKDVMIIDATLRIGRPFEEPLRVPDDVVSEVSKRLRI
jgi:2,5-furandicarboxylate decarboxylase 1